MPGTMRPPSLDEIEATPSPSSQPKPARAAAQSGAHVVNSPVAHATTNYAPSRNSLASAASFSQPNLLPKVCPECGLHYPAEFKVCPRDAVELNDAEADPKRDELIGQTLGATYTIL